MPPNSGLHFVPIPFSKTFADYYTLGELTHKEYPSLVPEGQAVDTIAVPAVLAVFNWSNLSYSPKLAKRATDVAQSRNSIHGSGCETESRID
jgi:hypothetical protein